MRIGLIARADKTGLGIQTYEFYRHMNPDKVLVVDLSHCSGQQPNMAMYPGATIWHDKRYPGVEIFHDPVVDEFLKDLDIVFTCETPYSYYLYAKAHEMGVKTVQQYNYEFLDYLCNQGLPFPDLLASPSTWHIEDVKRFPTRVEHLPVPVNRDLLPFRRRDRLTKILHTAGTPAVEDRNGTYLLAEAMRLVKSPVTLEIKSQKPLEIHGLRNTTIDYSKPDSYADLYGDHDAYVMPRKFGGLCLPMNEAVSTGMVVVSSRIPPQTSWLPPQCLVGGHVSKQIMTKTMIDIFETDIVELADKIDELAQDETLFGSLSDHMNALAENLDWKVQKQRYLDVFESLF